MIRRLLVLLCVGAAVACHSRSKAVRPLGFVVAEFNEISESTLATTLICNDTLGRPVGPEDSIAIVRCSPCMPLGIQGDFNGLRNHARKLWTQNARTPDDSIGIVGKCVDLAWRRAQALRPEHDSTLVESSLFRLTSAYDSTRTAALAALDSSLRAKQGAEANVSTSLFLGQLALGVWDRAQRLLERPTELEVAVVEARSRRLAEVAPVLTALPKIPETSKTLGESEAVWAARLFDAAAKHAPSVAVRARWQRLALSPWVVMEQWTLLDSAAQAALRISPNDSVVLPARALAAYKRMKKPALESPKVSALFDSLVRVLPRVDSARYDGFEGLLTKADDDWRFRFLPDQRRDMEVRGWSLVDPLWSTPVNEIQLAKRARIAEADYRFADIARVGESGSETKSGVMLLRLGSPEPRWAPFGSRMNGRRILKRGWPRMTAAVNLSDVPIELKYVVPNDLWRVFYGTALNGSRLPTFALSDGRRCVNGDMMMMTTLYDCAMEQPASWEGVPFHKTTSEIDVSVARFRSNGDSADVYIGARIPLRTFKAREDRDVEAGDRIAVGVWLATPLGQTVFHKSDAKELPARSTLAWTEQWKQRIGSPLMLHRVEAIETGRPSGARGVANFTSDAEVSFPLRGFGMSDILVAASFQSGIARRWSELVVQPNGGATPQSQSIALIWETYDLTPGNDGRVRWRVRIRRERGAIVARNDMPGVMSAKASSGTRVVASESDAADVSYARSEVAAGAILEHIMFGLTDAPVGRHVVKVTIDDLVSGKSVTRGVSVRVYAPNSERRPPR